MGLPFGHLGQEEQQEERHEGRMSSREKWKEGRGGRRRHSKIANLNGGEHCPLQHIDIFVVRITTFRYPQDN